MGRLKKAPSSPPKAGACHSPSWGCVLILLTVVKTTSFVLPALSSILSERCVNLLYCAGELAGGLPAPAGGRAGARQILAPPPASHRPNPPDSYGEVDRRVHRRRDGAPVRLRLPRGDLPQHGRFPGPG